MIATIKLLTSGSIVCAVYPRNACISTLENKLKIVQIKDALLSLALARKLKRVSSIRNFTNLHHSPADNIKKNFVQNSYKVCKDSKIMMEQSLDVCAVQKNVQTDNCKITNHLDENNLETNIDDVNIDTIIKGEKLYAPSMTEHRYEAIRPWKRVGPAMTDRNQETHFILKILSYNILAQNLLENHRYLYVKHDTETLHWERRMILLQREILKAEANVICLQEVLVDHLREFVAAFEKVGYNYLYKKRTNDKRDGLLLLYRRDQLQLVDHTKVELYRPNIKILNRDNVAIVAKFSLIESPETHVVISTTHLLYNPRRDDVRLAQAQLLFAEIEKLAFMKLTKKGPRYHPIILSGDFNLQPHTGVYKFITEGAFEFKDRCPNLQSKIAYGLGNSLIPPSLLITDGCQFYNILIERFQEEGKKMKELFETQIDKLNDREDRRIINNENCPESDNESNVNTQTFDYQKVKIIEGRYVKFSSGTLTHPLKLNSLYRHVDENSEPEATTNQGDWITVDYIFYNGLEPIFKYNLPSISECHHFPTIPNGVVGSDHLCLGASFKLQKVK